MLFLHTAHFLVFCILTNKMEKLHYNKTYHETYFVLGANSYMFRQQATIRAEFNINKGS